MAYKPDQSVKGKGSYNQLHRLKESVFNLWLSWAVALYDSSISVGMRFLKSFYCQSENVYVGLWGQDKNADGWGGGSGRISDIFIKQNDKKVWFGGFRFHPSDVGVGIRLAIEELEEDSALQEAKVWEEDEHDDQVWLARDGEGYRMRNVYPYTGEKMNDDDEMNKEWIRFENNYPFRLFLDLMDEYVFFGERNSDSEESSNEEECSDSDSEELNNKVCPHLN